MRGEKIYLDSSAIVKRYVKEPGSDYIRDLYLKSYSKDVILSYSIWNIGEVLGTLDRARLIGRIDDETYMILKRRFILETRRAMKLGSLLIIPIKINIFVESWRLIEKYHIYIADAIQVASAKYMNIFKFLTGDKRLHEIAIQEGLKSKYIG